MIVYDLMELIFFQSFFAKIIYFYSLEHWTLLNLVHQQLDTLLFTQRERSVLLYVCVRAIFIISQYVETHFVATVNSQCLLAYSSIAYH